jgi:hypothetical protein
MFIGSEEKPADDLLIANRPFIICNKPCFYNFALVIYVALIFLKHHNIGEDEYYNKPRRL